MNQFQALQILLQQLLKLAVICPRDLEVKCALALIEHFIQRVTFILAELDLSSQKLALQADQEVQYSAK